MKIPISSLYGLLVLFSMQLIESGHSKSHKDEDQKPLTTVINTTTQLPAPTYTNHTTTTPYQYSTMNSEELVEEELIEEANLLDEAWDALFAEEYHEANMTDTTYMPIAGQATDYGSYSLGVHTPSIIIGIVAASVFVVLLLICVGLKLRNSKRAKYSQLTDMEEHSNSPDAPLTG